jgi:hypothetical protein
MKLSEEKLKIATKILYLVRDYEALTFYHSLYLYIKKGGSKAKAEMIYSNRKSFIRGYYLPDEIKHTVKLYKRIFHNK